MIHFVLGTPFGLMYMLPDIHGPLIGMQVTEPALHMLFGAAIVALSYSSFLGSRGRNWDEVKIIVQLELVFTIMVDSISVWAITAGHFPKIVWLDVGVVFYLIAGYGYFFLRMRGEDARI